MTQKSFQELSDINQARSLAWRKGTEWSPTMIVAGTGHRPDKLGGYSDTVFDQLTLVAEAWLIINKTEKVISGMALGWDQALAQAAINQEVPFIAAIPFEGQERLWPKNSIAKYEELLAKACERVIVSPGPYAVYKMYRRNVWMVDHADHILALWDGSGGGTANCIAYALKQNKQITNVWDWYKDGAEDRHRGGSSLSEG
jgi:uncharacterized phage-like protein YoqJ